MLGERRILFLMNVIIKTILVWVTYIHELIYYFDNTDRTFFLVHVLNIIVQFGFFMCESGNLVDLCVVFITHKNVKSKFVPTSLEFHNYTGFKSYKVFPSYDDNDFRIGFWRIGETFVSQSKTKIFNYDYDGEMMCYQVCDALYSTNKFRCGDPITLNDKIISVVNAVVVTKKGYLYPISSFKGIRGRIACQDVSVSELSPGEMVYGPSTFKDRDLLKKHIAGLRTTVKSFNKENIGVKIYKASLGVRVVSFCNGVEMSHLYIDNVSLIDYFCGPCAPVSHSSVCSTGTWNNLTFIGNVSCHLHDSGKWGHMSCGPCIDAVPGQRKAHLLARRFKGPAKDYNCWLDKDSEETIWTKCEDALQLIVEGYKFTTSVKLTADTTYAISQTWNGSDPVFFRYSDEHKSYIGFFNGSLAVVTNHSLGDSRGSDDITCLGVDTVSIDQDTFVCIGDNKYPINDEIAITYPNETTIVKHRCFRYDGKLISGTPITNSSGHLVSVVTCSAKVNGSRYYSIQNKTQFDDPQAILIPTKWHSNNGRGRGRGRGKGSSRVFVQTQNKPQASAKAINTSSAIASDMVMLTNELAKVDEIIRVNTARKLAIQSQIAALNKQLSNVSVGRKNNSAPKGRQGGMFSGILGALIMLCLLISVASAATTAKSKLERNQPAQPTEWTVGMGSTLQAPKVTTTTTTATTTQKPYAVYDDLSTNTENDVLVKLNPDSNYTADTDIILENLEIKRQWRIARRQGRSVERDHRRVRRDTSVTTSDMALIGQKNGNELCNKVSIEGFDPQYCLTEAACNRASNEKFLAPGGKDCSFGWSGYSVSPSGDNYLYEGKRDRTCSLTCLPTESLIELMAIQRQHIACVCPILYALTRKPFIKSNKDKREFNGWDISIYKNTIKVRAQTIELSTDYLWDKGSPCRWGLATTDEMYDIISYYRCKPAPELPNPLKFVAINMPSKGTLSNVVNGVFYFAVFLIFTRYDYPIFGTLVAVAGFTYYPVQSTTCTVQGTLDLLDEVTSNSTHKVYQGDIVVSVGSCLKIGEHSSLLFKELYIEKQYISSGDVPFKQSLVCNYFDWDCPMTSSKACTQGNSDCSKTCKQEENCFTRYHCTSQKTWSGDSCFKSGASNTYSEVGISTGKDKSDYFRIYDLMTTDYVHSAVVEESRAIDFNDITINNQAYNVGKFVNVEEISLTPVYPTVYTQIAQSNTMRCSMSSTYPDKYCPGKLQNKTFKPFLVDCLTPEWEWQGDKYLIKYGTWDGATLFYHKFYACDGGMTVTPTELSDVKTVKYSLSTSRIKIRAAVPITHPTIEECSSVMDVKSTINAGLKDYYRYSIVSITGKTTESCIVSLHLDACTISESNERVVEAPQFHIIFKVICGIYTPSKMTLAVGSKSVDLNIDKGFARDVDYAVFSTTHSAFTRMMTNGTGLFNWIKGVTDYFPSNLNIFARWLHLGKWTDIIIGVFLAWIAFMALCNGAFAVSVVFGAASAFFFLPAVEGSVVDQGKCVFNFGYRLVDYMNYASMLPEPYFLDTVAIWVKAIYLYYSYYDYLYVSWILALFVFVSHDAGLFYAVRGTLVDPRRIRDVEVYRNSPMVGLIRRILPNQSRFVLRHALHSLHSGYYHPRNRLFTSDREFTLEEIDLAFTIGKVYGRTTSMNIGGKFLTYVEEFRCLLMCCHMMPLSFIERYKYFEQLDEDILCISEENVSFKSGYKLLKRLHHRGPFYSRPVVTENGVERLTYQFSGGCLVWSWRGVTSPSLVGLSGFFVITPDGSFIQYATTPKNKMKALRGPTSGTKLYTSKEGPSYDKFISAYNDSSLFESTFSKYLMTGLDRRTTSSVTLSFAKEPERKLAVVDQHVNVDCVMAEEHWDISHGPANCWIALDEAFSQVKMLGDLCIVYYDLNLPWSDLLKSMALYLAYEHKMRVCFYDISEPQHDLKSVSKALGQGEKLTPKKPKVGKLAAASSSTDQTVIKEMVFTPSNTNEIISPNSMHYLPFKAFLDKYEADSSVEIVEERKKDLFTTGDDYALVQCVSRDLKMSDGIAVEFQKVFGKFDATNVVIRPDQRFLNERYGNRDVFYLITKELYSDKPTYTALLDSLYQMRAYCEAVGVKKLAMPRIGCGIDGLNWLNVKALLNYAFSNSGMDILVCVYDPRKKSISKQSSVTSSSFEVIRSPSIISVNSSESGTKTPIVLRGGSILDFEGPVILFSACEHNGWSVNDVHCRLVRGAMKPGCRSDAPKCYNECLVVPTRFCKGKQIGEDVIESNLDIFVRRFIGKEIAVMALSSLPPHIEPIVNDVFAMHDCTVRYLDFEPNLQQSLSLARKEREDDMETKREIWAWLLEYWPANSIEAAVPYMWESWRRSAGEKYKNEPNFTPVDFAQLIDRDLIYCLANFVSDHDLARFEVEISMFKMTNWVATADNIRLLCCLNGVFAQDQDFETDLHAFVMSKQYPLRWLVDDTWEWYNDIATMLYSVNENWVGFASMGVWTADEFNRVGRCHELVCAELIPPDVLTTTVSDLTLKMSAYKPRPRAASGASSNSSDLEFSDITDEMQRLAFGKFRVFVTFIADGGGKVLSATVDESGRCSIKHNSASVIVGIDTPPGMVVHGLAWLSSRDYVIELTEEFNICFDLRKYYKCFATTEGRLRLNLVTNEWSKQLFDHQAKTTLSRPWNASATEWKSLRQSTLQKHTAVLDYNNPTDAGALDFPWLLDTTFVHARLVWTTGIGSGFMSSKHFTTCEHVTYGNDVIMAKSNNGSMYKKKWTNPTICDQQQDIVSYGEFEFATAVAGEYYALASLVDGRTAYFECVNTQTVIDDESGKFVCFRPVDIDWDNEIITAAEWTVKPGLSGTPFINTVGQEVGLYGTSKSVIMDGNTTSRIYQSPLPTNLVDRKAYFIDAALEVVSDVLGRDQHYFLLDAPTGTGKTTTFTIEMWKHCETNHHKAVLLLQPTRAAAMNTYENMVQAAKQMGDKYSVCLTMGGTTCKSYGNKNPRNPHLDIQTYGYYNSKARNNIDRYVNDYACVIHDEVHIRTDSTIMAAHLSLLKGGLFAKKWNKGPIAIMVTATDISFADAGRRLNGKRVLLGERYPITDIKVEIDKEDRSGYVHFKAHDYIKASEAKGIEFNISVRELENQRAIIFVHSINACLKLQKYLSKILTKTKVIAYYANCGQDTTQLPDKCVIVATDALGCSVTISNVDLVIDFGFEVKPKYELITDGGDGGDAINYTSDLETRIISTQVHQQRRGRTGRTCPGTVYRAFDFQKDTDLWPLSTMVQTVFTMYADDRNIKNNLFKKIVDGDASSKACGVLDSLVYITSRMSNGSSKLALLRNCERDPVGIFVRDVFSREWLNIQQSYKPEHVILHHQHPPAQNIKWAQEIVQCHGGENQLVQTEDEAYANMASRRMRIHDRINDCRSVASDDTYFRDILSMTRVSVNTKTMKMLNKSKPKEEPTKEASVEGVLGIIALISGTLTASMIANNMLEVYSNRYIQKVAYCDKVSVAAVTASQPVWTDDDVVQANAVIDFWSKISRWIKNQWRRIRSWFTKVKTKESANVFVDAVVNELATNTQFLVTSLGATGVIGGGSFIGAIGCWFDQLAFSMGRPMAVAICASTTALITWLGGPIVGAASVLISGFGYLMRQTLASDQGYRSAKIIDKNFGERGLMLLLSGSVGVGVGTAWAPYITRLMINSRKVSTTTGLNSYINDLSLGRVPALSSTGLVATARHFYKLLVLMIKGQPVDQGGVFATLASLVTNCMGASTLQIMSVMLMTASLVAVRYLLTLLVRENWIEFGNVKNSQAYSDLRDNVLDENLPDKFDLLVDAVAVACNPLSIVPIMIAAGTDIYTGANPSEAFKNSLSNYGGVNLISGLITTCWGLFESIIRQIPERHHESTTMGVFTLISTVSSAAWALVNWPKIKKVLHDIGVSIGVIKTPENTTESGDAFVLTSDEHVDAIKRWFSKVLADDNHPQHSTVSRCRNVFDKNLIPNEIKIRLIEHMTQVDKIKSIITAEEFNAAVATLKAPVSWFWLVWRAVKKGFNWVWHKFKSIIARVIRCVKRTFTKGAEGVGQLVGRGLVSEISKSVPFIKTPQIQESEASSEAISISSDSAILSALELITSKIKEGVLLGGDKITMLLSENLTRPTDLMAFIDWNKMTHDRPHYFGVKTDFDLDIFKIGGKHLASILGSNFSVTSSSDSHLVINFEGKLDLRYNVSWGDTWLHIHILTYFGDVNVFFQRTIEGGSRSIAITTGKASNVMATYLPLFVRCLVPVGLLSFTELTDITGASFLGNFSDDSRYRGYVSRWYSKISSYRPSVMSKLVDFGVSSVATMAKNLIKTQASNLVVLTSGLAELNTLLLYEPIVVRRWYLKHHAHYVQRMRLHVDTAPEMLSEIKNDVAMGKDLPSTVPPKHRFIPCPMPNFEGRCEMLRINMHQWLAFVNEAVATQPSSQALIYENYEQPIYDWNRAAQDNADHLSKLGFIVYVAHSETDCLRNTVVGNCACEFLIQANKEICFYSPCKMHGLTTTFDRNKFRTCYINWALKNCSKMKTELTMKSKEIMESSSPVYNTCRALFKRRNNTCVLPRPREYEPKGSEVACDLRISEAAFELRARHRLNRMSILFNHGYFWFLGVLASFFGLGWIISCLLSIIPACAQAALALFDHGKVQNEVERVKNLGNLAFSATPADVESGPDELDEGPLTDSDSTQEEHLFPEVIIRNPLDTGLFTDSDSDMDHEGSNGRAKYKFTWIDGFARNFADAVERLFFL